MNKFYPTLGLLLAALLTSSVGTAQDCNCVIEKINDRTVYSPACNQPREICGLELIGDLGRISMVEFSDLRDITITFNGNSQPRFLASALTNTGTQFTNVGRATVELRLMDDDRFTEVARFTSRNPNNAQSLSYLNGELAECTDNCTLGQPAVASTPPVNTDDNCECHIQHINNTVVYSRGCDYPLEVCGLEVGTNVSPIDLTRFADLRDVWVTLHANVYAFFKGSTLSNRHTFFNFYGGNIQIIVEYPGGKDAYRSSNDPNDEFSVQPFNRALATCEGTCSLREPSTSNQSFAVMPITLTEWTTTAEPTYVKLQWHTATERDNDFFRISRSTDGHHFEELGRVLGMGTTDEGTDYTYHDLSPVAGVSYYRLEQYDFDGSNTNLGIQTARMGGAMAAAFSVSPNPVQPGAQLSVHTATPQLDSRVQLIGPNGRLLGGYEISNGSIQLPELRPGVYTLKIGDTTSRFVVLP